MVAMEGKALNWFQWWQELIKGWVPSSLKGMQKNISTVCT
jgi:hypothetical protein